MRQGGADGHRVGPANGALTGNSKDVSDGGTGQSSLGDERTSWAGGDQFGEVFLLVGGDQDRRHTGAEPVLVNFSDDVKTALLAEIDINEGDVGPQFLDAPQPFCGGSCDRYHVNALMLEQLRRRIEKIAIVVDNHATRPLSAHQLSVG